MSRHRIELPAFAQTYLKGCTRKHSQKVVVLFHGWLRRTGRNLETVTGKGIAAFVAGPIGKPVGQMTRNNYRYEVRLYLRWLEERGLAGPFEKEELQGYHRQPLPDDVRRFLQYLAPIRQPSTVRMYRDVLRRLHRWLAEHGTCLEQMDRTLCLALGQHLQKLGMHPASRIGVLICIRKYFDWLFEQGAIAAPGRAMILAGDLPKKPQYLPRPLPPEADQKLQHRLKEADSPVALGLYVMRRTGLRVGELRHLQRDCVRVDHCGGQFLKVPLGKLNTERLVPLDEAALSAVTELQRRGHEQSPWLIQGARARPVSIDTYRSMLQKLGGDLPLPEPLTTHRLRHTFATSLMNGGMSLTGIMKLLGHRDHRMTLRYTQIADETVGREYFEALSRISERYELLRSGSENVEADPSQLLQDVLRWLRKHLCAGDLERRARLLVRRIEAARDELAELRGSAPST